MREPLIFCPHCEERMKVQQSGLQRHGGLLVMWRRRSCKHCNDGETYHTIEIEKPDNMKIDYG